MWLLVLAVVAYLVGFVALAPNAILVSDEAEYIGQASVFADGRVSEERRDPLSGTLVDQPLSDYPVGTALLQAPFVAVGGWRAASLASVLGLAATVAVLAWWLSKIDRPPLWALVVLAFPPALVLGRVGMSDVPSMALVTAALALFWTAPPDRRRRWLAAGLLGGVATTLREPNLLFIAPLFVGAFLRRQTGAWRLGAGLIAGVAVRLALSALVFADPLYLKPPGEYGPGLATHVQALVLLVVALTIMVPAGLVAVAAYRGPRRPEVVVTVIGAIAAYTAYGYSAAESGGAIRLVLVPRFVLPVVPLVVVAMADVVPGWIGRVPRAARTVRSPQTWAAATLAVIVLGTVIQAAVHRRGEREASVTRAIYQSTEVDDTLVINYGSLTKHLSPAFGRRTFIDRSRLDAEGVARLASAGPVKLVILDRFDSEFRAAEAAANQDFIDRVAARCPLEPEVDEDEPTGDHLRISRVRCEP